MKCLILTSIVSVGFILIGANQVMVWFSCNRHSRYQLAITGLAAIGVVIFTCFVTQSCGITDEVKD